MSAMLLCRSNRVKEPYYVDDLGLHIYSGEELSYYIYNNAMLIGEDFLSERLYHFLGEELGMTALEAKLRRWAPQAELYELLLVILQDIHYYDSAELNQFRRSLENLDRMSQAGKLRARGEYLLKNRRYTAALLQYDRLLGSNCYEMKDPQFAAEVWMAQGVVQARRYSWVEAADCLRRSIEIRPMEAAQRMLYQIRCFRPEIPISDKCFLGIPEETKKQWETALTDAQAEAAGIGKGREVQEFMQKDNIRRAEGLRSLTEEWKKEYRRNQGG